MMLPFMGVAFLYQLITKMILTDTPMGWSDLGNYSTEAFLLDDSRLRRVEAS